MPLFKYPYWLEVFNTLLTNNLIFDKLYHHTNPLPPKDLRKELDMMIAIITLIKAFIVGIVIGITYIIYLLLKYYLDK